MKTKNKILSIMMAISLPLVGMSPANAEESRPEQQKSNEESSFSWADQEAHEAMKSISEEDLSFLNKVVSASDGHTKRTEDDSLTIDLSDEELKKDYDFSEEEITTFHGVLAKDPEVIGAKTTGKKYVMPYDHRLLHISYEDLTAGTAAAIYTAALAGPETLEAAFIAWATVTGGPLGSAVSIAGTALGSYFFGDLALKIVGAAKNHQGLGFYSRWGIPPLDVRIEDD